MPISRRELMLGATGFFMRVKDKQKAPEQKQDIVVGRGQFTPFGTTDRLMNWQVLYRCGLNLGIENSPEMRESFLQAKDLGELQAMSGFVDSTDLYNLIIPRLPGGLGFIKAIYDKDTRPLLIAPDTHDLDNATGVVRDPWDYIGREVTLHAEQRILPDGTVTDIKHQAPAYIFDVLADEHRDLPVNQYFFCDADPHTYESLMGIHFHKEAPYFRSANGVTVSALPYVTMSYNPSQ